MMFSSLIHKKKLLYFFVAVPNPQLIFTDGLKLCDFGFSRAIEGNRNICEIQGTPDYVAP